MIFAKTVLTAFSLLIPPNPNKPCTYKAAGTTPGCARSPRTLNNQNIASPAVGMGLSVKVELKNHGLKTPK